MPGVDSANSCPIWLKSFNFDVIDFIETHQWSSDVTVGQCLEVSRQRARAVATHHCRSESSKIVHEVLRTLHDEQTPLEIVNAMLAENMVTEHLRANRSEHDVDSIDMDRSSAAKF